LSFRRTPLQTAPKRIRTYLPAFDLVPEAGEPLEIFPDFYWLRMVLPFELNHINLWLMQSGGTWSIVDTGFNYADTLEHWEKILADKKIGDIFITHFHPDHFGLAGYLSEKTGVTIKMTRAEYAMAQSLMQTDKLQEVYLPYYTEAGISGVLMSELMEKRLTYKKIVSKPPEKVDYVKAGDKITLGGKEWEVVHGGGHTPEHACLYNAEDKIFISADIVLPDITPNISYFPGSNDPVHEFLECLEAIKTIVPDDVIVLPSHGVPFKGLHRRIDEIIEHHYKRLIVIRNICSTPKTPIEIMNELFAHRKLGIHDLFFALGETMAHLIYDEKRGGLVKTLQNGAAYYVAKT
jgi:glyoxylase-like metal-dependent hydrolase (beta-lactamase superfamily II)